MDRSRDQILSHTGLTGEHDADIRLGHLVHVLHQIAHKRAFKDDLILAFGQFLAQ